MQYTLIIAPTDKALSHRRTTYRIDADYFETRETNLTFYVSALGLLNYCGRTEMQVASFSVLDAEYTVLTDLVKAGPADAIADRIDLDAIEDAAEPCRGRYDDCGSCNVAEDDIFMDEAHSLMTADERVAFAGYELIDALINKLNAR